MKSLRLWILLIFAAALLAGCGGSSGGDSSNTSDAVFVQEREFAQNENFCAQPDQVVALYLESVNDPGPADEDTGGVGDDRVKIKLKKEAGHEFKVEMPDNDSFTLTITGPKGKVVAVLDENSPSAVVDVDEGVHSLVLIHDVGAERNRALFIRPGSTIISPDCPGCDLSGANLKNHNLSNADLSGANFSDADLEYADLTGANTDGTDFTGSIITGMKGMYPAPAVGCTTGEDCYQVYPAACPWQWHSMSGTDSAQISFQQCNASGGNASNNVTTIGATSINPVGVTLPDGTYWLLTIESNSTKAPFYTHIKASNKNGWTYFLNCDSSASQKSGTPCGGSGLIETITGGKDFRTLCVPTDNSQILFNRIYLLDKMNGNYLFRGPEPCVEKGSDWSFDYDALKSGLAARLSKQANEKLPDQFHLIDISLIDDDHPGEGPMLQAEYEFFGGAAGTNPSADSYQPSSGYHTINDSKNTVDGKLLWWQIKAQASGAIDSDMKGLMDQICDMMNTDNTGDDATPYVIYFHCASGTDRTGAVAVSYLLKNRRMSSKDAYIYGTTVFELSGSSWVKYRLIPNQDFLMSAKLFNCQLCNKDSLECANLLQACPSETSTCSECLNACTDCSGLQHCWGNFSDTDSRPGSKDYPNDYPWQSTSWTGGCPK